MVSDYGLRLSLAMQDDRPVICGMNNPHGSDSKYALYPHPRYSAGGRLYHMVADAHRARGDAFVGDYLRHEYLGDFDRRNVLQATTWSRTAAKPAGARLVAELAGRRVVALGRQVAWALGLGDSGTWFERVEGAGFAAWVLPHPSGMNQMYNDPAVRARAGNLLLDLHAGTLR